MSGVLAKSSRRTGGAKASKEEIMETYEAMSFISEMLGLGLLVFVTLFLMDTAVSLRDKK